MRFKLSRRAAGALVVGIAVAISSLGVVRAERFSPDKKTKTSFNCSSGTACLSADSTGSNTYAISASGSSANTIQAQTTATNGDSAVAGISNAKTGRAEGLYGASNTGDGIYGITNAGSSSGYAGVYGLSTNGYGVYGQSTYDFGVYGYSGSSEGGEFASDGNYGAAVYAEGLAADTDPLVAFSKSENAYFLVDPDADGIFDGYVLAEGGFQDAQRARGGPRLQAFGAESTRATIEDTGTARLQAGEGIVRFDSAFASTIDAERGYQVFLTPGGETRGWLYVAAKYEGGFVVREAEHGRSSVYFDYRVVAHPYGASDARLPQLNLKAPPIPPLLRHPEPQR